MVSKKVMLEQLRNKLIYDLNRDVQQTALTTLWQEGEPEPEAIEIMIEALQSTQVVIKAEILNHLVFIEEEEVFSQLAQAVEECSEAAKWNILEAFEKLNLRSYFLEKMDSLRHTPDMFPLLAVMVRFLGHIQDQELIEHIGQLIHLDHDDLKLAVIEAVNCFEPDHCPGYLLKAMKFFNPEVARRALDLIGKLKDKNSVLPLIYVLGEVGGLMAEKIVQVLNGFDQKELENIVTNNIILTTGEKDHDLINAWIVYLERSGDVGKAEKTRRKHKIDNNTKTKVKKQTSASTLTIGFQDTQGIGIIKLNGIFDLYTLSGFERKVMEVIRQGFAKILLLCDRLITIDRHAIAYLDQTNSNLRKIMGGIKYVHLTCLPLSQKTVLMPDAEFFETLEAGMKSYTEISSDTVVKISPELFNKEDVVEVTFTFGRQEKHRAAKILSVDENWMKLSWETFDETDMFQEFENDDIRLSFVVHDEIFTADTKVCSQAGESIPQIKILFPRTGRPVKRIIYAHGSCRIPVSFRKMKDNREVSQTSYPGICLKISEGDIQLMTPLPLTKDSHIVLNFDPSQLKIKQVIGQVDRRIEHVENGRKMYDYNIIFATIRSECRDQIKKFVFELISRKASEEEEE